MTVPAPHIQDITVERESLTSCLQAIADAAGNPIDYDTIHAMLGLPLMVCARAGDRPDDWPWLARDVFLWRAARVLGIAVRAIHPPEAAVGLERSVEFAQHFDASYRPLILRALEHGQAVLAWRGWPEPAGMAWGLIRTTGDDGIGLAGWTAGGGDDVALVRPPVQLYVVEAAAPITPPADAVLPVALDHARRALSGDVGDRWGAVTGLAAYDRWIDRVARDAADGTPPVGARSRHAPVSAAAVHRDLASRVAASHASGVRFFERHRDAAGAGDAAVVASLVDACRCVVAVLTPPDDRAAARGRSSTPEDLRNLTSRIKNARRAADRARHALNARR
ncbi:MAG: hypothetical protein ACE5E6_08920 [Phycisphaerae bacterium]